MRVVCDNQTMKVSAVIITFNEEQNIAAAIESVHWADEVIVVDSESSDRTREIAAQRGARVIINKWPGFSKQKQFATEQATNDWVFSLDADERVTPKLANEIKGIIKESPTHHGYYVPRLSVYMGREIKHSGWYPDRQLRFFDRKKALWKDRLIHESVEMMAGASTANLDNNLLHYSVENAAHHHRMIGERYAPLAAQQMLSEGRTSSFLKTALAAPAAFIRSYILKLGFLDGFAGFSIAMFASHHAFLKYLILWQIQNKDPKSR